MPPTVGITGKPYAGRTFTIGKTLDSSDDEARLMLVTALRRHEDGQGVCGQDGRGHG